MEGTAAVAVGAANINRGTSFKEEELYHHLQDAADHDDREINVSSSENSGDSPPSTTCFSTSTSSPKRGRRGIQKRIVTVPIKDVEGLRLKGDSTTSPPSDSWAWRKYGQKPIKGSPYPRGYYRCSSSKGCPARKQVERSRTSPDMLVITYSYEHNHPWPASRSNHHHNHHSTTAATAAKYNSSPPTTPKNVTTCTNVTSNPHVINSEEEENEDAKPMKMISIKATTGRATTINHHVQPNNVSSSNNSIIINDDHDKLIADHFGGGHGSLLTTDDFSWFSDMDSTTTSSSLLGNTSSIFTRSTTTSSGSCTTTASGASLFHDCDDIMMSRLFPMREEDESLFADLGELPECSTVFGRSGKAVGVATTAGVAAATVELGR